MPSAIKAVESVRHFDATGGKERVEFGVGAEIRNLSSGNVINEVVYWSYWQLPQVRIPQIGLTN